MSLRSISRRDWNAATPKRTPRIIEPRHRKGVVIHWNGPPLRLNPEADPTSLRRREIAVVRAIQRFHQERQNWSDAAYSYLVGQSGAVFEVRGHEWDQFANGADNVGPDDGADRDFYTVMVMIGGGAVITAEVAGAALPTIFLLATLTKLFDQMFRYSTDRSALLVLYQPLPARQEVRAQTFIESIVEPVTGGITGVALVIRNDL